MMKKQNVILIFEDFLNTYQIKNNNHLAKSFFPIKLDDDISQELAYLIGKIMGDGNLDKVYTSRFIGKEKDLLLLKDMVMKKFNIESSKFSIRMRKNKGISYLLQINSAFLGRILHLLGAPIGNKTKTRFNIPLWIMKREVLKRRFLQALLEDELTTIRIERCSYSVKPRLKLAKKPHLIKNLERFLSKVKETIESVGIECSHISKPIKRKDTDS